MLTKADAVKPAQLARRLEEVRPWPAGRRPPIPLVIVTSSETGEGIAELRAEIAALAAR